MNLFEQIRRRREARERFAELIRGYRDVTSRVVPDWRIPEYLSYFDVMTKFNPEDAYLLGRELGARSRTGAESGREPAVGKAWFPAT